MTLPLITETNVRGLSMRGYLRRIVTTAAALMPIFLVAPAVISQQTLPDPQNAPTSIHATSTLVTVPTLVRTSTGELVKHLDASQFQLLDNGIVQKVLVEDTQNQPVALVIIMQTGGSAAHQFQSYRYLPYQLGSIVGSSTHEITFITFDSRIEEVWHFPVRSDGVAYALTHQRAGDQGAAIMDAVDDGVQLLQQEPGSFRRVVLLISQSQDDGSRISSEDFVRHLGKGSTAVYSITFSSLHAKSKGKTPASHRGDSPPKRSPKNPPPNEPDNSSARLNTALTAMHEDTAAEIALLSGGAQVNFTGKLDFDAGLVILASDIWNRYTLGFQPNSEEPGFHTLTIQAKRRRARFDVASRTGYWFDPVSTGK